MEDGWSRVASLTCLVIHYLVTGVSEVTQPTVSHHLGVEHMIVLMADEKGAKREERQTRPLKAYAQNWHAIMFTTFY